ncbi:MAG TPA: hypothetical protein VGF17_27760, partial [Phytomonospora sp.]
MSNTRRNLRLGLPLLAVGAFAALAMALAPAAVAGTGDHHGNPSCPAPVERGGHPTCPPTSSPPTTPPTTAPTTPPTSQPTSSPTSSPSESPSTSPSKSTAKPTTTPPGGLAKTGGPTSTIMLAGALLAGAGAVALILARTRRS